MPMPLSRSIRLNYLFYSCACGATYPYLAPFFKEVVGVSDRYLGLIMMIRPIMALVGQPIWSQVSDRSGRRSHLGAGLVFIASMLCPLLIFIHTPVWVCLVFALWSFFNAPLFTLSDSITYDYLGPARRDTIGRFRVFASMGFILAVTLVGFIYDRKGLQSQFAVFSVLGFLSFLILWPIPPVPRTTSLQSKSGIKALLKKRNVIIFLCSVFLIEITNAMALTFLSVYGRQLGANNMQIGWIWALGTCAEVITMLLFSRVYKRIGIKNILIIGYLAIVVRWGLSGLVTSWWQLLPVQLLHALTLTYVYIGSTLFMDMESTQHIRTTAQSFYTMVILNTAYVIGCGLGGFLSDHFGYSSMFFTCSLMGSVGLIILVFLVKSPADQHVAA
ncbi:MAG: MFS transporter [Phycisphaerae bacterium]|nr:MFS transporter [Phycisphaerae bacterium]